MHSQYYSQTSSSPYSGFNGQQQYHTAMIQGPGIAIANPAITPQTATGSKTGATGQKRKQVKNACVNCQKACKKCDEGRPCQRCVKYGLTDTCQDSTRKERKKGIKRGPYKRRQQNNQSANASASPSNVPLGNPMGTPQSSYSPRAQTMPFAYNPQNMNQFNQPYDPLNHHNYGYQQGYPKDHLIQQGQYMAMFPGGNQTLYNPMVPQQQEMLSRNGSMSPPLSNNFAATKTNSPMSQTHTPASTNSPSNAASPNPNDNEEEEGSKLAILSQLCSTVLDNNDAPKSEEVDHNPLSLEQQRGVSQEHSQLAGLKKRHGGLPNQTPPPSPHTHSRTPSFEHDQSHSHNQSQVYHSNHNSPHQPHYTMNGHLSAPQRVPFYGTPNASPSASPTDTSFSITLNNSPKNGHIAVSQSQQSSNSTTASPQQSFWPLPSLNSVVPEHYSYGNNHYQTNSNSHVQSQNGQSDWGIHVGGVGGTW